ncbi:MAG: heme ABC transporter ATP-binding protein [bacterium]
MSISLSVEDLEYSYDRHKVLDGISFAARPGNFVGIIGPNGSGKTTLLKNLCGLLKPLGGVVLIDGEDISSLRPKHLAREMAVVHQDTGLDFAFSALEVVLMGRNPYLRRFQSEGERDLEIARQVMKLTDTLHLQDRKITELSGGERQRVILARALAQEPRILLLDEPTVHLDIHHQIGILNLIRKLNRLTKLTVIAVLHDLNLAAQYSDYLLLMNCGRIEASGTPPEVLTAENIKRVYRMDVIVSRNPLTGSPNIIPVTRNLPEGEDLLRGRIHIVCGGGSGAYLMEQLAGRGYEISCGVLNVGDTDWQVARALGLEVVEEAPFSPIGERARFEHRELIRRADVIVLTNVPFGYGNLPNLRILVEDVSSAVPIYVVGRGDFRDGDYTNGEATRLLKELMHRGATVVSSQDELLQMLLHMPILG